MKSSAEKKQLKPSADKNGRHKQKKKVKSMASYTPFDSYWKDKLHLYTPFF